MSWQHGRQRFRILWVVFFVGLSAGLGQGPFARADFRSTVLGLSPTHYYALDELYQGINTVAHDLVATGGINGTYRGAWASVSGVDWQGFSTDNRAFLPDPLYSTQAAVDLGAKAHFTWDVMSVSLWVQVDPVADVKTDRLFSNNATSDNLQIVLTTAGSELRGVFVALASGTTVPTCYLPESSLNLADSQWHLLTVVRNGDLLAHLDVFVDGVDQSSSLSLITKSMSNDLSANAWIAGRSSISECLHGTVDEASFWCGRALTLAEHQAMYSAAMQSVIPSVPGDASGDGDVDDEDAAILAAHWLQSGKTWGDGDFNDDGVVDDRDAAILAAHWVRNTENASVPEPSTSLLLLTALATLWAVRRRWLPSPWIHLSRTC